MEFVVNREILLPALGKVIGVVERRQTLPILGNFRLAAREGELTILGTDLEVEVQTRCEAAVQEVGETTVPARKLVDICRNLGEGTDIRFRISDERCVVTAGRGRFSLGVLPAVDFPVMEQEQGGVEFGLDEAGFKRVLEKTAFAMAQQDVRYYLNGLLIEFDANGLTAVATDGHRLAKFNTDLGVAAVDGRQVILPSKTVLELRRQLGNSNDPVSVSLGEKSIRLVIGDMMMTSKLVDGRYPDYERVIPQQLAKSAVIDKEPLKRALSRTAILSNEKYRGVRLGFDNGLLKLQAHNPEQEEAEEEVEIEYQGEFTAIGFNVSYLTDLLGVLDGNEVEVSFQDGNSSSVWRGRDAEAETYVVMPMRL
ncbi:DNA polymerase III subunit beta [Marichromatium sp. AB31]|uniref:DNA polymerase III subunit beta n=1 Tax=Marichromatium sp. AB31 TaxID=2483362 RepID=UPI000F411C31|nr:DNA polymerase III subunit beta [Marichromatium sp. AB31]RNE92015.1 DNA polymerase III subunit beta [Marichromatium sp. AB31]